jgi:hypothetical protein
MKTDKRNLFIDTGAWIALLDRSDQYHQQAVSFYQTLHSATILVTSSHVIAETYTWLRYKTDYQIAQKFLSASREASSNRRLQIVHDNADLLEKTEQILTDFPDQKLSYVDAFSMAIMKGMEIQNIFCFDQHFCLIQARVYPAGGTLQHS